MLEFPWIIAYVVYLIFGGFLSTILMARGVGHPPTIISWIVLWPGMLLFSYIFLGGSGMGKRIIENLVHYFGFNDDSYKRLKELVNWILPKI